MKKKLPPGVRERNGRFTFRYSVEVVKNGKRTRKQKETRSFPTPEEAYEAGILIMADKLRGKNVDPSKTTLKAWCEQWLEDYRIERDPKATTLHQRETALESLKKSIGEYERICDITPRMYQNWLNGLRKEGKAKNTVVMYHSAGRMLFEAAVREGLIETSPADTAVLPAYKKSLKEVEQQEPLPEYMEKDQLKKFLEVTRFRGAAQMHSLFTLLAFTGMRIGEALGLKISDFDEAERTISIKRRVTTLGKVEEYDLDTPKNESSVRIVTIGETAIKAIKAQLAWREQHKKNFGLMHDANFLFWSESKPGYPLRYSTALYQFQRIVKMAELPESLTPHSLRHTHVSLLAEAGEDLTVIQERLGHQNDVMTRRVYLHVTEGRKKLTPDRFEAVMRS